MPLSSEQIRAARGLLNLSQKELAGEAGLSLNSLNNIERGVAHPRDESLKAIKKALEKHGIEFLEGDGVRRRGEKFNIKTLEGDNLIGKLYREILKRVATGKCKEVLYMGIDNDRMELIDHDDYQKYKTFEDELIAHDVGERLIFKDKDTNFLSRRNVYRWVEERLFGTVPIMIFGDRMAILLWGPPKRIVILQNASLAETFTHQFDAIWEMGKPVPDDIHEFHRYKDE